MRADIQGGQAATQVNVTLTGADQTVLAGNAHRVAFRIANNSNATVWIAYNTAASANNGMPIAAGGILFDEYFCGAVHARGAGAGDLTIIEHT